MKKMYCSLLAILLIASGCFHTTEDFTIKSNGSGVYAMKMDLSGMFDMLEAIKAMSGSDSLNEKADSPFAALGKSMDTVIHFSSFTDTASNLSPDEKVLMKDATMHMVMDEAKKKFVMDLQFPYKKPGDVKRIMDLSKNNGGLLGKALGGAGTEEMPPAPDFSSLFDYTFRDGLLEKKLNGEQYKNMQESPQFEQMKEGREMLGEATMNTVVRLPRKAKKAEGPGVKLSADGKTVSISASFTDLFDNPNALTFRIEY